MDAPRAVRINSTLPLVWSAGYEYVLVAIGILRDAGIDIDARFPEEGPDREHVLFTIHDLGLLDVVWLEPAVAVDAPTDIRLVTPLRDGLVSDEGTAAGSPIVATDLPVLRDRLRSRRDARFVPVRDPDAIAGAVCDLVGREI